MDGALSCNFWKHVDVRSPDECWLWRSGTTGKSGYGLSNRGKRRLTAHREAYERTYGSIPSGLFCLHRCDIKLCCNPSHLFLGTHQDNMDDMHLKGRHAHGESHGTALNPESIVKGEKRAFAKLNPESVQTIRSLAAQGISFRAIANRFGVSVSTAWRAARGVKWGHV